MIELRNVTKIYDGQVKAAEDVSFHVGEGEIFGLIGTSGCGKTTTLKMINRLVEPTSGEILVGGVDIRRKAEEELRRSIGYVIQDVGLFPHYSISENIATVPQLQGWSASRIEERCRELLNLVGLDPGRFAGRMPEALSGGQQQRVGFARALAADPPVILMDEPFGALDPITKERIQREFKELLVELHKTIVLVTHDVSEAFDLCDRVALMDKGRLKQVGTPKELLFGPENEFVDSFFESNRLELEMQTITVGDIFDYLERSGHSALESAGREEAADDRRQRFRAGTPFSEAYARSGESGNGTLVIEGSEGEKGRIASGDLLNAFHLARNEIAGRVSP